MRHVATIADLGIVFKNLVGSILSVAAILLFVLLLAGGFKYLTAGSDPKAVESAKKTISSAIIGVVVVAGSYLILVLIKKLTGANVTDFNIVGN